MLLMKHEFGKQFWYFPNVTDTVPFYFYFFSSQQETTEHIYTYKGDAYNEIKKKCNQPIEFNQLNNMKCLQSLYIRGDFLK